MQPGPRRQVHAAGDSRTGSPAHPLAQRLHMRRANGKADIDAAKLDPETPNDHAVNASAHADQAPYQDPDARALPKIQVCGRQLRDLITKSLKALRRYNDPPRLFIR